MSKINTGGPAFPLVYVVPPENVLTVYQGMTLRDYFAAKATEDDVKAHQEGPITDHIVEGANGYKHIVKRSTTYTREQAKYRYADAMIKARTQSN